MLLRSATLPGREYVLPLLCAEPFRNAGRVGGPVSRPCRVAPGPDLEEMARGFASLGDLETRQAFIHTVRAIMDIGGQRVSARTACTWPRRCPRCSSGGARPHDPSDHGRAAHESMPGSRFLVYEKAGHFPHRDEPLRFAADLLDFVHTTAPAEVDLRSVRELIQRGVVLGERSAQRGRDLEHRAAWCPADRRGVDEPVDQPSLARAVPCTPASRSNPA